MLYDKEVCTVYKAENGFVVKCASHEKSSPSKKGEVSPMPEPEVYLAKSVKEVLKLVEDAASGKKTEEQEYKRGFEEAAASK